MQATFKLNIQNLNSDFIKKIKNLYHQNANVEIFINDEIDDTDYLLSTENNIRSLQKSINEINNNQIITKSEDYFK